MMGENMKSWDWAKDEKNSTSLHSFSAHGLASLTENREPSNVRLALARRSGFKQAARGSTLLIQK
jgi:hypothetical protein